MCFQPSSVAHITGADNGLTAIGQARAAVKPMLANYSVLTWTGESLKGGGFTEVIQDFLHNRPDRKVVAFRQVGLSRLEFEQSWNSIASAHPGQFLVVELDVEAEAARLGATWEWDTQHGPLPAGVRHHFLLGRIAVKSTATSRVLALGGGGCPSLECRLGMGAGAHWSVLALSRGGKEPFPGVADYAASIA